MRTQRVSPGAKLKGPTRRERFDVRLSKLRDELNALTPGASIVVFDEAEGEVFAGFIRVTRGGKGSDVMIEREEIVRGNVKRVKCGVPITDVIRIEPRERVTKTKAKPMPWRKHDPGDWRTLAEDAIKALRETAQDADGELRHKTFTRVGSLARRAAKLAGQLEMFT